MGFDFKNKLPVVIDEEQHWNAGKKLVYTEKTDTKKMVHFLGKNHVVLLAWAFFKQKKNYECLYFFFFSFHLKFCASILTKKLFKVRYSISRDLWAPRSSSNQYC